MLKLDTIINSADSPVLLSTQMMENGYVLHTPEKKAQFVLKHLNNESYTRYSNAPSKIEPTMSAACVWLAAHTLAQNQGSEMVWFIYDKTTKSCCGIINIKETAKGEVEIGQVVSLRDYQSRYGALKLLHNYLEKSKNIKKLKIKVLANDTDNVYHSYLRGLGYQVENITHNRLLNLDSKDYVIYSKTQAIAVPVIQASKRNIVPIERILPCQYSRIA